MRYDSGDRVSIGYNPVYPFVKESFKHCLADFYIGSSCIYCKL